MATTLSLLQAYPLGTLEVEMHETSLNAQRTELVYTSIGRGTVIGLESTLQGNVVGHYAKVQYDNGDGSCHVSTLTPYLKSFDQLCAPLADGTVPAVEVAKLAVWVPSELEQPEYLWQYSGAEHDEDEYGNEYIAVRLCKVGGPNDLLYIFSHWDIITPNGFSNQPQVFDYLKANHFALPLHGTPLLEGQDYLRKE